MRLREEETREVDFSIKEIKEGVKMVVSQVWDS